MVLTADAAGVRGGSLASHARDFWRHRTPWAIAGFFVVEPVIEWAVHSWVLHARPWRLLGRTFELSAAKGHRKHHEDPLDLSLVFVPRWVLVAFAPAVTVALFLLLPKHLAATLLASGATALLAYEWTHYLIHTAYRPCSRYYRHLWRHHRLHHYRNEGYWFGVTTAVGDALLGTCPRGAEVPVSPTAKTLGTPLK